MLSSIIRPKLEESKEIQPIFWLEVYYVGPLLAVIFPFLL